MSNFDNVIVEPKEAKRLATLDSYGMIDTDREEGFDRISKLASDIYNVPMAAISLIDSHRNWFKSSIGLFTDHTPKDISFCQHIISSKMPLVVSDTLKDKRFRDNPFVIGPMGLRFYAGYPLIAPDGMVIGSLWIGDTKPHKNTEQTQFDQLQNLAGIVMSEFELRREVLRRKLAEQQSENDRKRLEISLGMSKTAAFFLDMETEKLTWAGAYKQIWGDDADEVLVDESSVLARIHPKDVDKVRDAMANAGLPGERYEVAFRIILPSGAMRWISSQGDMVAIDGRPTLTGMNHDITSEKQREDQQTLFTRELHHRLRNLFAMLQSIMALTKKSATSIDDYVERIESRLRALNRAQQVLLDSNFVTGSLSSLIQDLSQAYPNIRWHGPAVTLSENAMVSLSLILTELATNAVKYGPLSRGKGMVEIDWDVSKDSDDVEYVTLTWRETGGASDFGEPSNSGFGSSLINHSVSQNLQGHIKREWLASGLICTLEFPLPSGSLHNEFPYSQ